MLSGRSNRKPNPLWLKQQMQIIGSLKWGVHKTSGLPGCYDVEYDSISLWFSWFCVLPCVRKMVTVAMRPHASLTVYRGRWLLSSLKAEWKSRLWQDLLWTNHYYGWVSLYQWRSRPGGAVSPTLISQWLQSGWRLQSNHKIQCQGGN